MTYTVALVTDAVEVGTADPQTLQGVIKNGQFEWERLGGAKLVANQLAKFGLTAIVQDDESCVVYCTTEA